MPYDASYDEDDDRHAVVPGKDRRFGDFDCPQCNANNPWDEGIGNGEEVRCYYCGQQYLVEVTDEGKLRLREA